MVKRLVTGEKGRWRKDRSMHKGRRNKNDFRGERNSIEGVVDMNRKGGNFKKVEGVQGLKWDVNNYFLIRDCSFQ